MDSTLSFINNPSDLERVLFSMVQSVVAETALLAQQSLLLLLFVMRSQPDDMNVVPDISTTDKRFPFAELNRVEKAAAENKDAGETDEEDGDDDDGDDDQEEDDGSSGEEGSDDDDEDDSEGDADSDGGSNEDDEDDEDNDNDDDDNDDDEDEDEEEEEENQPPYKRKKMSSSNFFLLIPFKIDWVGGILFYLSIDKNQKILIISFQELENDIN